MGVYAVKVKTDYFNKNGIANIGYRPTFNGESLLLEKNIFRNYIHPLMYIFESTKLPNHPKGTKSDGYKDCQMYSNE